MPSDRSLLERQMQRVELRPFTLDGFHRRRQRNQRNRRIGTAVLALAVAAAGIGGLVRAFSTGPVPAGDPRNPFLGTWVNSDPDGSTQTMSIRAAEDGVLDIVMHDDAATVCSGAPSTTTGTGRLESAGELVIPSPVLTCDDGNEPEDLGPPLEEVLRNMTFVHNPETDVLTDNFGLVWEREGREPTMSGGMWPQSSLEKVREAQELADAGDPRYTWQVWPNVFPKRPGQMDPRVVEFFTRFLQEELGWEEFSWGVAPGLYAGVLNDWPWEFVVVRCAPDRTNPLYPNDPEGRGCAPTIGEHRYETVRINADQPVRNWEDPNGPSGIWVVTRWAMLQPSDAPITGAFYRDESGDPFRSLVLPHGRQRQVQQVVPPSDAEATAFLRAFLQARVDGEGAEEYLPPEDAQIPLLYATTSDAPYERFEFELVQGPVWPGGWREFKVRLFAEGGRSEVEQPLVVEHAEDGRLVLVYGTLEDGEAPTTENGEPLLALQHPRRRGDLRRAPALVPILRLRPRDDRPGWAHNRRQLRGVARPLAG